MRVHVCVSMPEKGGRPAIAISEVRRAPDQAGRRRWHYVIGHVERVRSHTIQGTRDRIEELTLPVKDVKPCVFVDAGTAQGFALRRSIRAGWPEDLHRPHAYERTRFDQTMFGQFLEAYADGRITFKSGIDPQVRKELDRALILYRVGAAIKKSDAGDELASEDEALVHAVCLATMWPTHGPEPKDLEPAPDDGVVESPSVATTTPTL